MQGCKQGEQSEGGGSERGVQEGLVLCSCHETGLCVYVCVCVCVWGGGGGGGGQTWRCGNVEPQTFGIAALTICSIVYVYHSALHLAIINNQQERVLWLLDAILQLPPTETPIVDSLNNFKEVREFAP